MIYLKELCCCWPNEYLLHYLHVIVIYIYFNLVVFFCFFGGEEGYKFWWQTKSQTSHSLLITHLQQRNMKNLVTPFQEYTDNMSTQAQQCLMGIKASKFTDHSQSSNLFCIIYIYIYICQRFATAPTTPPGWCGIWLCYHDGGGCPGVGVTLALFVNLSAKGNFYLFWGTSHILWITFICDSTYLNGVTAIKLLQHLSNMNFIFNRQQVVWWFWKELVN